MVLVVRPGVRNGDQRSSGFDPLTQGGGTSRREVGLCDEDYLEGLDCVWLEKACHSWIDSTAKTRSRFLP